MQCKLLAGSASFILQAPAPAVPAATNQEMLLPARAAANERWTLMN